MVKLATKRLFSSSNNRPVFLQDIANSIGVGYNALKGTIFQAMAQRMNEKDRISMIQHWGGATSPPLESNSHVEIKPFRPLPQPNLTIAESAEEVNLFHPVLGELICDLGYKKLYLTNVRSLAMAPVWKKQRILRPERAQLIAADKIKNKLASSISGTITFFINKSTQEVGIIDGQHRAGALMVLAQKGYWSESERNILVEVFPSESDAQVSALFREINAAEPVRLVDMVAHDAATDAATDAAAADAAADAATSCGVQADGGAAAATTTTESVDVAAGEIAAVNATPAPSPQPADHTEILTAAADLLAQEHADMFKASSRCKPPHLNVDVLRDDLFQSSFLARHEVRSVAELLGLLRRANASVKAQYSAAPAPASKSMQAALKKAAEHDFYLGIDKAWLYQTYGKDA